MAKKKLACASCGMAVKRKMKKGGVAPEPFAAGIPYKSGAGQFDGKNGMMKKGGATRSATDCPRGYVLVGGKCVSKIAAGIIGGGAAGMATEVIQNIRANKPIRQAKRDSRKAEKMSRDLIAKKKMGGSLKPVPSGNKGLAKLPTAVRNKMGYQKRGGAIKRK